MDTTTLTTVARIFYRLDDLFPDVRSFQVSETGISFDYGRPVGYRGEYETEYERISLSWDEFLDEEGVYPTLETICKTKWHAARSEREKAEEIEKAKKAQIEAEKQAEAQREHDLAQLHKLMAAYPDEVSRTLFTNLPTTTS